MARMKDELIANSGRSGWIRDLSRIITREDADTPKENSELSICPCCKAPAFKTTISSKVVEHENDSGYMERSTLPGTSTYRYVGLSDGEPILPRTIDTKSVIELQSTIVHLGNIIQRDYLELLHTRRKIANQRETLSTLQANFEEVKRDNDIEITSLRAENDKLWELFESQEEVERCLVNYCSRNSRPADKLFDEYREAITKRNIIFKTVSEMTHVRRNRQSEN